MRLAALSFLLTWCVVFAAFSQQDTSAGRKAPSYRHISIGGNSLLDSVANAMQARKLFVADSMAMRFIRIPDSTTTSEFTDSILAHTQYKGYGFLDIHLKTKGRVRDGLSRPQRDPWIIAIIICLLLYTAILNITLHSDVNFVWQSFYSKRVLSQAGKEEGVVSLWAFLGLFLLFCLTFSLFLYQLAAFKGVYYVVSGSRLFVLLTIGVIALFALKFVVLKLLGFVFDINKLVNEYLNILHLTYFNIAFVFLPVVICFSMLGVQYIPILLNLTIIVVIVIFLWQYLRSSVSIISTFRFHKFYLFTYLCALEICPILILIKALNIRI
ncbi:DUF4271 domain-containing protein [Mucilaginibacter sp. AW1-7]|jgi:hypothetical protein|uniref:DUF4271 domain-containing protein n=1 Tax=unclassified Mucilaginibacter TaxID=2617802 RepID=UPI0023667469|nr:DUF4271 domain-containing protein [Mucilaginibacter sp. KACC 22773]WDF78898.1 DUF4271 domain-containing protein [Mucilaginibacter sp. KACC 22773]